MHVEYIEAITKRYNALGYAPYGWAQADSPPVLTPLTKPLGECRIGMMSTSGAYVRGQTAYYYKDDTSTRGIPKDTAKDDIHFSHLTENYLEDPRKDPDCIVPLTALRRLKDEGVIGEVADKVYSCMGGIYSQRRVIDELIPDLTNKFRDQRVDAAFLVPM